MKLPWRQKTKPAPPPVSQAVIPLAAPEPARRALEWLPAVPPSSPSPPATASAETRDVAGLGDLSQIARALVGGRLTLDTEETYFGTTHVILPPAEPDLNWRVARLDEDEDALNRFTPAQLLQLLADLSPEVSRALWDFLRLCNPGWEATALRPGTQESDPVAQQALDAFLERLHDLYGTVDVVLGRLFMGAFLRGALMAELVLDEDGRTPIDLATPDPHSARFRLQQDPVRGNYWQLGQWQVSGFIPLDRITVRYLPVDPFPGAPYGRPLAAPAVFTSLFLLGLLHDLRRVVAQQGYPRLDLAIDLERLKATMPEDAAEKPDVFLAWAQALQRQVESAYRDLQPDDAYVHSDVVSVNRPVGAVDASSLGAVDGLIAALERMSTRALKSMPLLMGTTEGVSEANANRQWELQAAGVKSLQHLVETLLERLMGLALRAQGIQATVQWRFAELRAAEMMRDAQTERLAIDNAFRQYAYGWISQDEAAQQIAGHKADVPSPRLIPSTSTLSLPTAVETATADPGANRGRRSLHLISAPSVPPGDHPS